MSHRLCDKEDPPHLNSLIVNCLIANHTKKNSSLVLPYTKNYMTDKIMNILY